MKNIKTTDRFRIWEIDDKQGYADVKMSESRKVREENSYDLTQAENGVSKNGYISTSWAYIRFVGHAYNKLKEINVGDAITNLSMDISKEPYFGDINSEKNAAIDLLEKANIVPFGSIQRLPKQNGVVYPKNVRVTVFSFEKVDDVANNYSQSNNIDIAPQVEDTPAQVVQQAPIQPVASIPTPIVETNMMQASDECPF